MCQNIKRWLWILERILWFISPVVIKDQAVGFVQQLKYLAMIINNKLDFDLQVDAVCRKAHQCVRYSYPQHFYVNGLLLFKWICSYILSFFFWAQVTEPETKRDFKV